VGVVDDRRGLGPIVRLGAFAGAGLILALPNDRIATTMSVLAAVALVMVTINAVNLFDGLDGLAGSVVAVAALGLTSMAAKQGLAVPWAGVVVAAALVGFLLFNLPPARLFLGDNGAYVAGTTLAWLALRVSEDWSAGAVALAAIGVPVLDLTVTVVRRLRAGAPLFGGDRDHTYDRLHRRGWGPGPVTAVFAAGQLVWSAVVVGTAVMVGDRPAAVVAAVLGLVVVVWFGIRAGRSEPAPG
jgi:UDP-GlcNAc:undecaprenyl-phosphate GlcNAc-1-phosphate transferase